MNNRIRFALTALTLAALFAALAGSPNAAPLAQSPGQRAIVQADDAGGQKALAQAGARLLVDYGPFALWELPAGAGPSPSALSAASTSALTTIPLRGGQVIDTSGGPSIGALAAAGEGPGLYLVQFIGPILDEWLDALRTSGLRIVQYTPHNAYVVWGDTAALAALGRWNAASDAVQWTGPYRAEYRLAPALAPLAAAGSVEPLDVTVQLDAVAAAASGNVAALQALAAATLRPPSTVAGLTAVTVRLPADRVAEVAAWADVYNVEPYHPPVPLDEAQGQIVAGHVTGSSPVTPAGPGYLAWLASKGFPTAPGSYPIVDVVDDGLDGGDPANVLHPDFHELGLLANPDRVYNIQNCTSDAAGDGGDGHGNLNAGIVGSYNNLSGSPHVDGQGYRIGLGISPYGRLASTKIFGNGTVGGQGPYDLDRCGWTNQGVLERSRLNGASITSNSWGDSAAPGDYNTDSRDYDVFTRDASADANLQPMLHVFAAGNDGSGANTVTTPGTAKNVLTVGATENVRDHGISDGCGVNNANNADDIIYFSSRGPADDGRVKPDIMAPGVHIQGPASQSAVYDGTGVCGAVSGDKYYPAGQTRYTWSSGTSHSTPAVSGAAQLAWEYYRRALRPGVTPSPAMVKALLINGARYLTGTSANDTLPSNNQGWGDANLGQLTDGVTRRAVDQADAGALFGATGQTYTLTGQVSNPTKPLRVTLVWSDAPGPTTGGAALVNDLNLEVTVDGVVYRGNRFSGRSSVSGGAFDALNNVENVFLPAGTTGVVQVRVIAQNIAGDGAPGNADTTDQDFALVAYNVADAPQAASLNAVSVDRSIVTGDGDVLIDAGETVSVSVTLQNVGGSAATGIGGEMSVLSGNAVLEPGASASAYPDIPAGEQATNQAAYRFRVDDGVTCGSLVRLQHVVTFSGTLHYTHTLNFTVGAVGSSLVTYPYTGGATAIPDYSAITSTLTVAQSATIQDLDVQVDLAHTWDADLVLTLVSPSGAQVVLSNRRGSGGDNFTGTIFDDEATTPISGGSAPFAGRFRPEGALSSLDGQSIAGQWQLRVEDAALQDTGTLLGWSLRVTQQDIGSCDDPVFFYLPELMSGAE